MKSPNTPRAASVAMLAGLLAVVVAFVRVSRHPSATDASPRDAGSVETVVAAIPNGATPNPAMPTSVAATSAAGTNAAKKAWWATLSHAEIAARKKDFELMHDSPGAFPEFVEIHRQMVDAGVPRDLYELECREVYGALLDRTQYGGLEDEILLPVRMNPDHPFPEVREALSRQYGAKRLAAETELRERLESVGFAPDSEPVARIYQLRPRNPLRRLDTDPVPSVAPLFGPSIADVMAARAAEYRAKTDAARSP